MRNRRAFWAVVVLLGGGGIGARPLRAERVRLDGGPSATAAVFVGGSAFGDDVALASGDGAPAGVGMAVGGRAALVLLEGLGPAAASRLALETESRIAFISTARIGGGGAAATAIAARAHLLFEMLADRDLSPLMLAGLGIETLWDAQGVAGGALALHAGIGARARVSRTSGIRFDVRGAALAGPEGGVGRSIEFHLGYVVELGGSGPRIGRRQLAGRDEPQSPGVFAYGPAPFFLPAEQRAALVGIAGGWPAPPEIDDWFRSGPEPVWVSRLEHGGGESPVPVWLKP